MGPGQVVGKDAAAASPQHAHIKASKYFAPKRICLTTYPCNHK